MHKICEVYWIHLEEHSDYLTQGYVGVSSKGALKRFDQHFKLAHLNNQTTLSKAIRKYSSRLIVTVLTSGDKEFAYFVESILRPNERCGWNILPGGGCPPTNNVPHTEAAKKKISSAAKINCFSPASVNARLKRVGIPRTAESKAKMKLAAFGRLPWETSRSNKNLWSMADILYMFYIEHANFGSIKLEKHFNLPLGSLKAIHWKFNKENWIPHKDQEWSKWSAEYLKLKESQ